MLTKKNWVVLARAEINGSEYWIQFTASYARTRRGAIARAIAGPENSYRYGTFRAVPAHHWGSTVLIPAR